MFCAHLPLTPCWKRSLSRVYFNIDVICPKRRFIYSSLVRDKKEKTTKMTKKSRTDGKSELIGNYTKKMMFMNVFACDEVSSWIRYVFNPYDEELNPVDIKNIFF